MCSLVTTIRHRRTDDVSGSPLMAGRARGPLRICIIGAGIMGRWHAAAARHAKAVVTSVVDQQMDRAVLLARQYGALATTDPDQGMDECDIVHICAPLPAHFALVRSALARGRSVICEKPLTDDFERTEAVLQDAAQRGLILVPTHQFIFQRGFVRALRALPQLGALQHVDTVACTVGARGHDADRREQVALDILPHPLSLFERIRPGTVATCTWQLAGAVPGEIRATASSGAVTFSMLISNTGRPPINQLRFISEGGTITVDLFHGFHTVDRRTGGSRGQKLRQPFRDASLTLTAATSNLGRRLLSREWAYPGLRELVAETYSSVRDGQPAPIAPEEIAAVARATDQIRHLRANAGVSDTGRTRDSLGH